MNLAYVEVGKNIKIVAGNNKIPKRINFKILDPKIQQKINFIPRL